MTSVVTTVASLALAAWRPGNGFNVTDESFYLLAVDPAHPGDAFNGLWGYYVRLLWQVAGWNVGAVRLLGLAVLVGTACALGYRLAPAISFPRGTTVAVCASGAVAFYSLGLRTPSYNWLAVEGAALAVTALLPNGHVVRRRDGVLAATGVFLAGAGKPTTGLICLVIVAGLSLGPWVPGGRRTAALTFGSTLAGLLAVHFVAVLSPSRTFAVVSESAAIMRSVDPGHYSLAGSITFLVGNTVDLLRTQATAGGVFLGLLPILALGARFRRSRSPRWAPTEWFTALSVVAVTAATGFSLGQGTWGGGGPGWGRESGGVAVLVTTMGLILAGAAALRRVDVSGPTARLGILIGGAALATAWGSNTGLGFVINFASLLVVAFVLVAANAFEPPTARALKQALSVASCVAVLVMSVQGLRTPFFMEARSTSTNPVSFGRFVVRLGPDTTRRLEIIEQQARTAGWTDGTKLVDTTFTPGIGLALRAEVPPALLPAFPGYPISSLCTTVPPVAEWQDAWILVRRDMSLPDREFLAAVLGRHYPDGYVQAGQWDNDHRSAELWKPVGPANGRVASPCAGKR